jgi:choline dehydrogenase-like flavoprotein
MLIDSRTIPADAVIETDLCIVGAGAAGITIARALRGVACRVLVLESGTEWPALRTQALYRGPNIGRRYFPLDGCRVRAFGGSTHRWGGWCRALDADDFVARPWVAESGWPFGREEVAQYYPEARQLLELAVTSGDIDHGPPIPERPRLALPAELRTVMYEFSPPTRFGRLYRNDLARAANVSVYMAANVVALEGGEHGGPMTAVRVRTLAGREWRVRAQVFVLATGGIENPRLLLASRDACPDGLANEHDLVGRYFMEHLHVPLGCFVPARPESNLSLYVEGGRGARRPLGALTVAPAERRARELYGFSAVFFPPRRRAVARVLRRQVRARPGWGLHGLSIARAGAIGFELRVVDKLNRMAREAAANRTFPRLVRGGASTPRLSLRELPPVYELMGRGEQTPLWDSRVSLRAERDPIGVPVVQLDWRVNPADLRNIRRSLGAIAAGLAASGAGTVSMPDVADDVWAERIVGSWHHMGTTRMHPDPRHGIVDATCRAHAVPNLFVTGSSVFPTTGFANPTLTIIAMALRLAAELTREMQSLAPAVTGTASNPPLGVVRSASRVS